MAKKTESKNNKRILLVDDDAEIIESLRLALEAHDYEVLIARDGNQGLALIENRADWLWSNHKSSSRGLPGCRL